MLYDVQKEMPGELDDLYERMMAELERCGGEADSALMAAECCAANAERAMEDLRVWVEENPFATDEEEVCFFKYIKPAFYCRLLYYKELYALELYRPRGGRKQVRKYLKKHLRLVQGRIEGQEKLHVYIRSGDRIHDQEYFLRFWRKEGFPAGTLKMEGDPGFRSVKDEEVAEIMRDDLLVEYLERELAGIEVPQGTAHNMLPGFRRLKWTGKIKWLGQLSYGLARSGLLGDATVIDVARALGYIFHADLKNLYRANQEDRISKEPGDGIKFILDAYLKDTDEKDLHPRR